MKGHLQFLSGAVYFSSLLLSQVARAQTSEEFLVESRNLAAQKNYDQALDKLNWALQKYPQDYDLLMMKTRVTAWNGYFDEAKEQVKFILKKWPDNQEALELRVDINYWAQDFPEMLEEANSSVIKYPQHAEFYLKKAIALEQLQRYEESLAQLKKVLTLEPSNEHGLRLERSVMEKLLKNNLMLNYRISLFDKSFSNWHNASITFIRNTGIGALMGRVNYGYQFDLSDVQYEADMYPQFDKNTYGYFNAGISTGRIFPSYRVGAELYRVLPKAFEISAGARFLNYNSDEVTLYTASAGKYAGNYWISLRGYFDSDSGGSSVTGNIIARRYISDRDHYLGIWAAFGNAPTNIVTIQEINRLNSARVSLEYQHKFSIHTLAKVIAEGQNEEYTTGEFQNRLSFEIFLVQRF